MLRRHAELPLEIGPGAQRITQTLQISYPTQPVGLGVRRVELDDPVERSDRAQRFSLDYTGTHPDQMDLPDGQEYLRTIRGQLRRLSVSLEGPSGPPRLPFQRSTQDHPCLKIVGESFRGLFRQFQRHLVAPRIERLLRLPDNVLLLCAQRRSPERHQQDRSQNDHEFLYVETAHSPLIYSHSPLTIPIVLIR